MIWAYPLEVAVEGGYTEVIYFKSAIDRAEYADRNGGYVLPRRKVDARVLEA